MYSYWPLQYNYWLSSKFIMYSYWLFPPPASCVLIPFSNACIWCHKYTQLLIFFSLLASFVIKYKCNYLLFTGVLCPFIDFWSLIASCAVHKMSLQYLMYIWTYYNAIFIENELIWFLMMIKSGWLSCSRAMWQPAVSMM